METRVLHIVQTIAAVSVQNRVLTLVKAGARTVALLSAIFSVLPNVLMGLVWICHPEHDEEFQQKESEFSRFPFAMAQEGNLLICSDSVRISKKWRISRSKILVK